MKNPRHLKDDERQPGAPVRLVEGTSIHTDAKGKHTVKTPNRFTRRAEVNRGYRRIAVPEVGTAYNGLAGKNDAATPSYAERVAARQAVKAGNNERRAKALARRPRPATQTPVSRVELRLKRAELRKAGAL